MTSATYQQITPNRDREHLIGLLKDEVDGKVISSFHVSSTKCYKVTFTDTGMAKCKGVPKSVSKNTQLKCIEIVPYSVKKYNTVCNNKLWSR